MTSAFRVLTKGDSPEFPTVAGGKEEAGTTTEFLKCSYPVFGTPPVSGSRRSLAWLPATLWELMLHLLGIPSLVTMLLLVFFIE